MDVGPIVSLPLGTKGDRITFFYWQSLTKVGKSNPVGFNSAAECKILALVLSLFSELSNLQSSTQINFIAPFSKNEDSLPPRDPGARTHRINSLPTEALLPPAAARCLTNGILSDFDPPIPPIEDVFPRVRYARYRGNTLCISCII